MQANSPGEPVLHQNDGAVAVPGHGLGARRAARGARGPPFMRWVQWSR